MKEAKKVRSLLGSLSWRERSERVRMTNVVGKKGSSGLKFLLVDVKTEVPLNRSSWSWLMLRTYRHPFLKSRETIILLKVVENNERLLARLSFETQANNSDYVIA